MGSILGDKLKSLNTAYFHFFGVVRLGSSLGLDTKQLLLDFLSLHWSLRDSGCYSHIVFERNQDHLRLTIHPTILVSSYDNFLRKPVNFFVLVDPTKPVTAHHSNEFVLHYVWLKFSSTYITIFGVGDFCPVFCAGVGAGDALRVSGCWCVSVVVVPRCCTGHSFHRLYYDLCVLY